MNLATAIQQLSQEAILKQQRVRTRLAPTPSGFLHQGNLYNFILNWWLARAASGSVLLRIDDLDRQRVRTAYVDFIYRCLDWLELDWDEGPGSPYDLNSQWSQEHRMPTYRALLQRMQSYKLLYACRCSRASRSFKPCACRYQESLQQQKEANIKLAMPEEMDICDKDSVSGVLLRFQDKPEDPMVWKKNDTPAYHLASVADDLHFQVSHVIRGADLIPSTLIQKQLAHLANLPAFEEVSIGHHPLLHDAQGHKLSKSAGSRSVKPALQEDPGSFLRAFAAWAGLPHADQIQRITDILQIPVDKC